jgi:hypothetical protein
MICWKVGFWTDMGAPRHVAARIGAKRGFYWVSADRACSAVGAGSLSLLRPSHSAK